MKMKNFISTLYVYGVEKEANDNEGGSSERIDLEDDEYNLDDNDASDDDGLIDEVTLQLDDEDSEGHDPSQPTPIVVYSESDDD